MNDELRNAIADYLGVLRKRTALGSFRDGYNSQDQEITVDQLHANEIIGIMKRYGYTKPGPLIQPTKEQVVRKVEERKPTLSAVIARWIPMYQMLKAAEGVDQEVAVWGDALLELLETLKLADAEIKKLTGAGFTTEEDCPECQASGIVPGKHDILPKCCTTCRGTGRVDVGMVKMVEALKKIRESIHCGKCRCQCPIEDEKSEAR
ncbi:MAG: hypothetical protein A4E57_04417 [Syntrophorhabdaceae bacterium PtaU1.Bin034]|nr:MAG: hypothetical protein A4E57_04417 [Syntrophorhabdaceae bacterium PtaU1.Bin034]